MRSRRRPTRSWWTHGKVELVPQKGRISTKNDHDEEEGGGRRRKEEEEAEEEQEEEDEYDDQHHKPKGSALAFSMTWSVSL